MLNAIVHASCLLTGEGIRKKDGRRVAVSDMGTLVDGAIVYSSKNGIPDRVLWTGPTREMPKKYSKVRKRNLKGLSAIVPGFVDCHTHLVFAGDRSEEFAHRCAGATYQELAARGGGILSTVRATREASTAELERLAFARVRESYAFGVRTLEIKSGYGLSLDSELKILEVIARIRKRFPEMAIHSTFLGAHAFPPEKSRQDYLDEIIHDMLPALAKRKLARSCDVFIDEGYFTVAEARAILERAKELGISSKVHADELAGTESAGFAAEIGALSADHLLKISDYGISKIASSKTVAVLLPGTSLFLKTAPAPARKLIEAGAAVALATDFNPGSCNCNSLPTIMTLAAIELGMSTAEIFAAVTYNGAKALGLENSRGTLEPGMDAAFAVLPFRRFEDVYYRLAWAPGIAR